MTSFMLKIIAVITMVLDHVKYAIPFTDNFITQYFGRISFPIFAFLITEGYIHTKSRKKYIIRLVVVAILSQIPFMLFRTLVADIFLLNILFTFLFALLGIKIYEYFKENLETHKAISYMIIIISLFAIIIIGNFIPVDYGWFGILIVWLFYLFKNKKSLIIFSYSILVFIYYFSTVSFNFKLLNWVTIIFTIIPLILILLYKGKEGRKIKYLFYFFYPLHMLILYIINIYI